MRTDRPSNPISTSIVSLLVALVGSAFAIAASSPIGLTDQAPQASPSFVPALERTDAVGHALEQGTIFVVTTAGDDGPGSLRRAIEAANATPNREGSRDRIVFQIAGPGPHSIRLTSALPPITESVVIYGYSQPGSAPNSRVTGSDAMVMIELDGTQSDGAHGLIINSSDSIVHGLAIHGFAGDGIRVIGGARNWIAGNLIGASSTPGVSGGNGGHGVLVLDSFDNLIGGLAPAARNEICGSGASGVLVAGDRSIGNTIVGNSIHANLAAGIELEGRAALDSADRDTGPNLQQNRPLLTRVYWPEASDDEAPGARIEGTLESAPSTRYRLEFFVTRASEMPGDRGDRSPLDPRSLPVQGEKLLVATDVVTASDGTAHFVAIVPDGVESHALVTATATDPLGNTSEFSDPVLAPTVIKSWNNAAGGNWSVGTNWTPNGVPATTDDVQITLAGTYTVTLDVSSTVASLTLGAATGTQTLSIAANTLTLSGASSVSSNGVLAQSGGTITGAGTLTVNGAYNWSAGTLTGAGTTTINGTLTLSGGAVKDITSSRTLNTTSTVTWSGTGAVRIGSGSVINNSGTWDCQTDSNIQNPFGGTATFNNSGTFKKSAGTGTSTVFNSLTAFNNTGSVLAQSGTLNLLAAGTHTGAFNGSGGQVQFSTSVHNLNAGTSFTGNIELVSGALSVNSPLTVVAFTQSGGTLQGTATFTTTGLYTWTAGTMTAAGITNVNGGLAMNGGTVDITGGRTLNNPATATMSVNAVVRVGSGSVINNTGTWDCQNDTNLQNPFGGTATFNNSGTFKKSAGTGTTTVFNSLTAFHNTGSVLAQSGTLSLLAAGTHTGAFNGSGGKVQFSTSVHDLNAGTSFTGNIELISGFLSVNSPLTVVTFTQSGGTLQGTATFSTTGLYTWTAGTMTAAGITNVNGGLAMNGGTVDITGGRTLNNPATATMSVNAVVRVGSGSVINNTGTWDCQNDTNLQNPFGGTATFNNSGTFKKSAGTGTTTVFNSLTAFHNTGSVLAQSGTLNLLAAGTHTGAFNGSGGQVQFSTSVHNLNAGTSFTGNIELVSGALSVNSPLTVVAFTQSGGTLQGTAAFTTTGLYTWTAGTMTAAGITNVNGGLAMNGGTVDITGGRTLNNPATATMSVNAVVRVGSGSVINNTGTWDCQNDTNLQNPFGGTATFNNSGTFKKSAGTGTTTVFNSLTAFHNTGSVLAQSGTLSLLAAGTHTGAFNGSGGKVQFSTSVHDLNAGTSFAGNIELVSGTLNVNSALTAPTFTQSGGTLQGTATFTTTGLYTWTGGAMAAAGITNANGGIAISSGTVDITGGRTLNNPATATWSGSQPVRIGTGAIVNNTGTWDCQTDSNIQNPFGGTATFNNSGTFKKSAGAGVTTVFSSITGFNNTGTVLAQTGTITLQPNGTHTGSFSGSGGKVQFAVGTHNLNAGTSFSGLVELLSGILSVNSPLTVSTLTQSGGTLQGAATFTTTGLYSWTAGTITAAGIVNANGGMSLTGSGVKDVTGSRTLNVGGSTTWTGVGGLRIGTGAVVNNSGTWDCQSDAPISNPFGGTASFNNNAAGIFKKTIGTGTTTVSIPMTNSGAVQALSGTLSFTATPTGFTQTAGSTTLNGGTLTSTTTLAIQAGTFTGIGSATASVNSSGRVAPGLPLGLLSTSGNYTQSSTGSFDVEIGGLVAGTDYDQLNVTGSGIASLAGTLNVTLANGFVPSVASSFTIMRYVSETGTFSTVNVPPLAVGCWQVNYKPTAVLLDFLTTTPDVTGLRFATDKTTLNWNALAPVPGPTAVYDLMRGLTSQFPVGGKPAETCLASATTATSRTDATLPALGTSFYYLVRGINSCGPGTYGSSSSGVPRTPTVCP